MTRRGMRAGSLRVLAIDPWGVGSLGVQRLPIGHTSAQETGPLGHLDRRLQPLGQEGPEIGVVPAEVVPRRVAVIPDPCPEPADLLPQLLHGQGLKILVHVRRHGGSLLPRRGVRDGVATVTPMGALSGLVDRGLMAPDWAEALAPVDERIAAIDQVSVLGHVDLVVHHGGSGTLLGAVQHGLPQVVVPQGADQFWSGNRLVEQGVARFVLPSGPPGSVRAAVTTLVDPARTREGGSAAAAVGAGELPEPGRRRSERLRRWARGSHRH